MIDVVLSLGGNVGDVIARIKETEKALSSLSFVYDVVFSDFYRTSPVSDIPQDDFINAACRLKTTLPLKVLWKAIEHIEKELGKVQKAKNAPRPIDIDIVFYGNECMCDDELQVPHPRWRDRLFVLVPLFELMPYKEIEDRIFELKALGIDRIEKYVQLEEEYGASESEKFSYRKRAASHDHFRAMCH